jgi:hypothetical protein
MKSHEISFTDLEKGFRESLPPTVWKAVADLLGNALWRRVCKVLYDTPINARMTQSELIKKIKAFTEENKVDYDQLNEELKALEENGCLYVEDRSVPNYFLTPLAVEAIEVANSIESEVVMSLAEEFKDNKSLKCSDIEKRVRKDIGSFLT